MAGPRDRHRDTQAWSSGCGHSDFLRTQSECVGLTIKFMFYKLKLSVRQLSGQLIFRWFPPGPSESPSVRVTLGEASGSPEWEPSGAALCTPRAAGAVLSMGSQRSGVPAWEFSSREVSGVWLMDLRWRLTLAGLAGCSLSQLLTWPAPARIILAAARLCPSLSPAAN